MEENCPHLNSVDSGVSKYNFRSPRKHISPKAPQRFLEFFLLIERTVATPGNKIIHGLRARCHNTSSVHCAVCSAPRQVSLHFFLRSANLKSRILRPVMFDEVKGGAQGHAASPRARGGSSEGVEPPGKRARPPGTPT